MLFDGTCAVCDATVQWVLRRDPDGRFWFAPLGGPTAEAVRQRHPQMPADLDSIVLVEQGPEGERVWWWSSAVLRVAVRLGGPIGAAARAASWVPRPLRDVGYRAFAAWRIRIFGRIEQCALVSPEQAARFLE